MLWLFEAFYIPEITLLDKLCHLQYISVGPVYNVSYSAATVLLVNRRMWNITGRDLSSVIYNNDKNNFTPYLYYTIFTEQS